MRRILFSILLICPLLQIYSQNTRELVNEGVDLYNKKEYSESEINFLKGLEESPANFEAKFNLGDAYYKQQKYDEALKSFNSALEMADSKDRKAKVHHNIGNSLLKSQKLQESIEAYKSALKLNPDDQETKYNLAYAQAMLNQQNQKQDQKNDQNKDQNKNEDKKDQQQNGDNEKKDQQKENQQDQQQNKSPEDQQSQQDNLKQPQKNEISKEEAQRILDALKNNEKDLQKKLRRKAGSTVKTEKDW